MFGNYTLQQVFSKKSLESRYSFQNERVFLAVCCMQMGVALSFVNVRLREHVSC